MQTFAGAARTVSDFAVFGRYLSRQRELRGLRRDEIAQLTKIPPTLVAALEDGQPDRLPERVFVINYIRAYASAIGLSPDEALNRFHEIPETVVAPEASPKELESARRRRAMRNLVILLVCLAVGAYAGLVLLGHLPSPF
ncbi:MAG: helix-turn-helix domain-containing protein [Myxococcaceae bacterium]|nr:helix-turn-helix domain-containing protein [Myxococcaceae bacterium]